MHFNLFYSAAGFLNIASTLLGGIMIDKVGLQAVTLVISISAALGQAVFAIGINTESFALSLLGRTIFGSSMQVVGMCLTICIIKWFTGKELSMGIGAKVSSGLLSMVLCFLTQPTIVKLSHSLELSIWIGFGCSLISVISICLLIRIDSKRDMLLGIHTQGIIPEEKKFKFADIKKFKLIYWLLLIEAVLIECSISCFANIGSKYNQERFGYNSVEAGAILSIPVILGAIASPFIGMTVDKIGKRVLMLIIAAILVATCQMLLLITPDSHKPTAPTLYICLAGLGNSLFSSVFWAALSLVVDRKALGTANGCIHSFRNMAVVVAPMVVGYLVDHTERDHGYFWVSFFLALLSGLGVVNGIFVYIIDVKNGAVLDSIDASTAKAKTLTITNKNAASPLDIQLITIS